MPKKSEYQTFKQRQAENPKLSMPRAWDSSSPLKVNVSQHNIDTAIPANSGHCMIADGMKDAFDWVKKVTVDLQTIRFTDKRKGLRFEYLTPRPVQEALVDYDWGTQIKPFSFTLRAPRITAAAITKKKKMSPETKKKLLESLKKARLARRSKTDESHRLIPGVVGGRPAPTGALAHGPGRRPEARYGARREFGIRGLVRNRPKVESESNV